MATSTQHVVGDFDGFATGTGPRLCVSVPTVQRETSSAEAHRPTWTTINEAKAKYRRPARLPSHTRRPFYASDKKAVCEMHIANPRMTHQQIADQFQVSRSIITRVLKDKEKWMKSKHVDGPKFARNVKRRLKFWPIDRELKPWLLQCRNEKVTVTDKMIIDRAILVAEDEGMREGGHSRQFRCGRAWVRKFKERFGIINGTATRLGYTKTELARENAFGSFPLDMPFWIQIPDERGNYPLRSPPCKGKYDDMDWEIIGDFVQYTPRPAPIESTTSESHAPPVSQTISPSSSPSTSATPIATPISPFDPMHPYWRRSGSDIAWGDVSGLLQDDCQDHTEPLGDFRAQSPQEHVVQPFVVGGPSRSPSRPGHSPAYSLATPGSVTYPEATAHDPSAGEPFHVPYTYGGYQESFLRGSKD